MAKRSMIQGYVELASGLGEMTKGAARDAAALEGARRKRARTQEARGRSLTRGAGLPRRS